MPIYLRSKGLGTVGFLFYYWVVPPGTNVPQLTVHSLKRSSGVFEVCGCYKQGCYERASIGFLREYVFVSLRQMPGMQAVGRMGRTPNAVLNGSVECEHLVCTQSYIAPSSGTLAVGLLCMLLWSWGNSPLFLVLWVFLSWTSAKWCKMFSMITSYYIVTFLLIKQMTLISSFNIESSSHSWNKTHFMLYFLSYGHF